MRNLLLFPFPSLTARSAFLGWKILLINPERLGDSLQMAVAYLPLSILLCFSTYIFFYFLESGEVFYLLVLWNRRKEERGLQVGR